MHDMHKMFRRASKSNYVDMQRLKAFDPAQNVKRRESQVQKMEMERLQAEEEAKAAARAGIWHN